MTPRQPLYVRMLRLRRLNPGPLARFGLLEGTLLLGVLLALSELTPWWLGLSLPVLVAGVVKLIDAYPTLRADLAAVLTNRSPEPRPRSVGDLAGQRPGYGAGYSNAAARDSQDPAGELAHNDGVYRGRVAGGRVARGVASVPAEARSPGQPPVAGPRRAVGAWPMPVDSPVPLVAARSAPPAAPAQRLGGARSAPVPAVNVEHPRRSAVEQLRMARARLNRGRFSNAR